MKEILVFGAGGHAKVIIDIIEKQNEYKLVGLIDPYKEKNEEHFGYPILGNNRDYSIINRVYGGIIAIGDNWVRYKTSLFIISKNNSFRFMCFIHPFSMIARGVKIGKGSIIMPGVIINSDTIIGNHCIINTNTSIDHDCNIGNYVSLAPKVTTGGHVNISDYSAIGLGTNIIQNINIGEHTIIGAGSTVVRHIGSNIVAFGTPCKKKRTRRIGEKYLK
jgi:sugar O-acyltransferase (sialic acid O-acetyltransferase NeuD family)